MSLGEALLALIHEDGLWNVVAAIWATALPLALIVLAWRTKLGYTIVDHRHRKAETARIIHARKNTVNQEIEARVVEHEDRADREKGKDKS